jgi:thioredoxin
MEEIRSLSEFNKLKTKTLLIIDFYATWCGPCKAISPAFEKLSKQHESSSTFITFAKLDVDKAKDVAQACGITAMPTFQFFKGGKKVDEVKGADVQQLTTKIGYYTAAAVKENSAQGTNAGASSEKSASKDTTPGSLRSLIDIPAARLLNASNLSSVRNIVSPPPAGYAIASASGPRVLIHLPFTQAVTPSTLKITIGKDAAPNAPSRIQVGTNVPVRITKNNEGVESNDLDLEASLAKAENTQAFNVYSDEYVNGTAELKLKASKFTSIKSLTIRIDANMSGEDNVVSKVGVMDIVGTKA